MKTYQSETPDPPLILIVDDDLANLRQLSNFLKKNGYQVAFAGNGGEFIGAINNIIPDLIICDMHVPDISINELDGLMASMHIKKEIPILHLVSGFNTETIEKAFKAGASDYLIKPAIFPELLTKIAHHIERLTLRQENELMKKEMERLSLIDSLTELYTRHYILQRLDEEVAEAGRYSKVLSIAVLQLDHLKSITDLYGIEISDEIIATTAFSIVKELREVDIIGRYEHETFLTIMPNTSGKDAWNTASRIREIIAANHRYPKELNITISGAIIELKDEEATELISNAISLLAKAKSSGGNQIFIA